MRVAERLVCIKRYASPCGELLLGSYGDKLCLCDWTARMRRSQIDQRLLRELDTQMMEGDSETLLAATRQLDEYFCGERRVFDLPMLMIGTAFQRRIWQELVKIPYGAIVSYAELARRIGNPTAVRAVANANGANAISIFVPCHRVIGANGTLTGYAGGLNTKRFLLNMEAENLSLLAN
ncbi:MAG: methylated-DNA--[protein]-cysteine S-methyltransferase [Prevotellaceae bacterium]|nr:methylated-DNA--[protein]-cysteine S-methyltransferase [Prevotellaceae bacterium]